MRLNVHHSRGFRSLVAPRHQRVLARLGGVFTPKQARIGFELLDVGCPQAPVRRVFNDPPSGHVWTTY